MLEWRASIDVILVMVGWKWVMLVLFRMVSIEWVLLLDVWYLIVNAF